MPLAIGDLVHHLEHVDQVHRVEALEVSDKAAVLVVRADEEPRGVTRRGGRAEKFKHVRV